MKNFGLFVFAIIFISHSNAQGYRVEINDLKYEGFVDSIEMNVTFYIGNLYGLSNESVVKLYLPDMTSIKNLNQVDGCFKNMEDKLLICKKFEVMEDVILIKGVDYRKLLGDKYRALRLCFEFLSPMYFIFIDWK